MLTLILYRKKILYATGFALMILAYTNIWVIGLIWNIPWVTSKLQSTNKTLEGQGVIVNTKGGIGNQLFEYACFYALAKERNSLLYIYGERRDKTAKLSPPPVRHFLPHQREFALDKFQIPMDNVIDATVTINYTLVDYISDEQILHGSYSNKPLLELSGPSYCQSEAYWNRYKSEIISMFRLKPEVIRDFPPYVSMLEKEIEGTEESVAIHVRRGDFLKNDGYFLPISYQRAGVRRLLKILNERRNNVSSKTASNALPTFFVFSDDIEYTRDKFKDFTASYKFVFVSKFNSTGRRTTSLEDFHLMTKCKHFIIPNSTFAWWIAYLSMKWGSRWPSSERIVIASAFSPKFWKLWKNERDKKFKRMLYGQMYHPKEWIIINPFIGEK